MVSITARFQHSHYCSSFCSHTNEIHHKDNHKSTESRIVNEEDKLKMQSLKNSSMAERIGNRIEREMIRFDS
ncbi:hypothetical protein QL285_095445 [Trifolium repens]|nr:hypothetical protein QL285_095445 [Trifolium repens]